MPHRHPVLAVALVALVAPVLAGCSGDEEAPVAAPGPTIPAEVHEVCTDPVGDLSTLAIEQGTLTEPAGIDLVEGTVDLDRAALRVRFDLNGDLAAVPDPTLTLFQGPPALLASWELRFEPRAGSWSATLITYAPGAGRIKVQEVKRSVEADIELTDTTLTATIARDLLPPPLTLAWVFGTASTVPDDAPDAGDQATSAGATVVRGERTITTFDECDTLFSTALDDREAGTSGAPPATGAEPSPPGDEAPTGGVEPSPPGDEAPAGGAEPSPGG